MGTKNKSFDESIAVERCKELDLQYVDTVIHSSPRTLHYVRFICPRHSYKGVSEMEWHHFMRAKKGCPYCTGRYKTTEDFRSEVAAITTTVEVLGEYKSARSKIECRCKSCGHEWAPEARSLLYGQGCPECGERSRHDKKRKTQQEFEEELSVVAPNIKVMGEYRGTHKIIECACTIHNRTWKSYPANLLNKSAGCPACAQERMENFISNGERRIAKHLDELGVTYITQQTFDDCVYRRPLKFDFYLPEYNTIIEYDGQQHYEWVPFWYETEEEFFDLQARDRYKDTYCEQKGIEMLRIPYTKDDHLEEIIDECIGEQQNDIA